MTELEPPPAGQDQPPSRTFKVVFAALMVGIALGYAWLWRAKTERVVVETPPAVAISSIATYVGGDSADSPELATLLAQHVGRVRGLEVMSLQQLRDAVPTDSGAPRRARMRQVFAGALHADNGGYRLDVRRLNLRMDSLLYEFHVRGASTDEVAYRAAVQVAMMFGLPLPPRDSAQSPSQ